MARPIYYDGSNDLREMSDAQLDRLQYYLLVAYANQLNVNGDGYIFIGSGATAIGSAVDTKSTQQINSTAAPSNDRITQTYPAYPGVGTTTVTTYNYQQDRTYPSFPTAAVLDESGYAYLNGTNIAVASTAAHLYDEVISQAITDLRTGSRVGSYQVATSTPTAGGPGLWTNKGTWFLDTRYNNVGNTVYTLYLKRNLTVVPGSNVYPLGIVSSSDGNLRQRDITDTSPLIQNVLLPAMTRRLANASGLRYTVSTTQTGVNCGSFKDTKYPAINDRYSTGTGLNEVYYSRSTPNTAATANTVNTYYLNLI